MKKLIELNSVELASKIYKSIIETEDPKDAILLYQQKIYKITQDLISFAIDCVPGQMPDKDILIEKLTIEKYKEFFEEYLDD